MKVENNRNLFHILVGLVSSGANAYDHDDADVAALAGRIRDLNIPADVLGWFARARTGQVEVNPYWPRGSELAAACFFMDNGRFDMDAFFDFLKSADTAGEISDPIGAEDFREWIAGFPEALKCIQAHGAVESLWEAYCQIVDGRMAGWNDVIDAAVRAAQGFFGDDAPEMRFSPNLFAAYSTDFVRIGNCVITIAAEPDVESMLHETLHTAVAAHREGIMAFAEKRGLAGLADRGKMMEFGYMTDDSAASMAHVLEECFVRAISVMLAGKGDGRLRVHGEYGCDGVPYIGSEFGRIRPPASDLGEFINGVLSNAPNQ